MFSAEVYKALDHGLLFEDINSTVKYSDLDNLVVQETTALKDVVYSEPSFDRDVDKIASFEPAAAKVSTAEIVSNHSDSSDDFVPGKNIVFSLSVLAY